MSRKEKKMFDKLNARRTVREGIDTDSMEFVKLQEYLGQTIKADGFFFTDGKFGEQVVVVANGTLVNMPQRAVKQFKAIEENEEMLHATLTGHLGIEVTKMVKTKNGETVSYKLVDLK